MMGKDQLAILGYHGVVRTPLKLYDWCFIEERVFRKQMAYLKAHFDVLPLSVAVERCLRGMIARRTAVVTIDDGFQNTFDVAFPILREFGLPATLFVCTRFIDSEDTIWFCRLNRALADTRCRLLQWQGRSIPLGNLAEKAEASANLQEALKAFPQPRLSAELRQILIDLGDDPERPIGPRSPYRMLSHEAITRMAQSGLIGLGAHSHSHAILSLLPSAEQRKEIEESVGTVRALTGRPCDSFSYPNGQAQDYDSATMAVLRQCGIRFAATSMGGPNGPGTEPLELRRYGVRAGLSMLQFQAIVHHTAAFLRRGLRLRRMFC